MWFISKWFIQFHYYPIYVINRQISFQNVMFRDEYGVGLCFFSIVLFVLRNTVGIQNSTVASGSLGHRSVAFSLDFNLYVTAIGIFGIYIKAEAVLGEVLVFLLCLYTLHNYAVVTKDYTDDKLRTFNIVLHADTQKIIIH